MTKKNAKQADTKAIEDKVTITLALKKMNSKLTSTKKDLENQVEDLSAQVKKLSKASGKQALKLLKKLDEGYQRKLVNLQSKFEKRLASLSTVQDKVLQRLPKVIANKIVATESAIAKSADSQKLIHKTPLSKPRPKQAIKASTAKLATIASIKSIGPVMQKKLAAKGITTLEDIVNTPQSKIETLKQFKNERGFNTWEEQAKALLASNLCA